MRFAQTHAQERQSAQKSLFSLSIDPQIQTLKLPKTRDWGTLDKLQKEFEALGFYLSAHPLNVYGETLTKLNLVKSSTLSEQVDGSTFKMAGVILVKQERTSKSGQKFAFIQCSDAYGVFEVAVFSELYSQSREILIPGTALSITATIRFDGEGYRLTAQHLGFLDQIIQDQTQQIKITLSENVAIPSLLETLGSIAIGPSLLTFEIKFNNLPSVIVQTSRRFAFSAEARSSLQSIPGLIAID
jgi:DNA polymerase-3 subunit alpha